MSKAVFGFFFTFSLICSAFSYSVGTAQAEEQVVCAFIYPCLDSGEINPKYDVRGYCGDLWRSQCMSHEELLRACEKQVDFSETYIVNLQKKLSRLQRKLTKSKKSSK